jgi:hypothetical protein
MSNKIINNILGTIIDIASSIMMKYKL